MDRISAEQAIARALEALRETGDAALEQIGQALEAVGDPHAAFRIATDLLEGLRGIQRDQRTRASSIRGRQAVRIRDAEQLSLAKLADRIGLSKPRADQLVNAADPPPTEGE